MKYLPYNFQSIMLAMAQHVHCVPILTLQKKIVRIMVGVKPWNSCGNLFKRLEILSLPCEYIFSLINIIITNQKCFQTNSALHSVNTRNKNHLLRPIVDLSCFQKSAYYAGIKIFNTLPSSLKSLMNEKPQFKVVLKRYLIHTHSTLLMNSYFLKMTHTFKGLCTYIG
jgi:hypothetical protein